MKKIIINSLYIVISVIAVVLIHNFIYTPNSFVSWCEDLYEPYFATLIPSTTYNIFNNNSHHSALYSVFYDLLSVYLPRIFDIHPLKCFLNITSYIVSFIFLLLVYVNSLSFSKYFKNQNIITCFIGLLIFPVFITFMHLTGMFYSAYNLSWTTAYFILPIFVFTLFNELENHFILKQNFSKRKIIVLVTLLFILANSFEIYRYIIFVFLFIRILLYAIFEKDKQNLKHYLYLFFTYTFFNLILLFIYHNGSNYKFIDFSSSEIIISQIKGFISSYWNCLIVTNLISIILIFLSLIAVFFAVNNSSRKNDFYLYIFSLIIAVMSYPLPTMFINFNPNGKQFDYYFSYTCDHAGTRFVVAIFLLNILLVCLGFLFSSIKEKKNKIIIYSIFSILILIPYISKGLYYFNEWHYDVHEYQKDSFFKERNTNLYILEKFWAMYGRKHGEFYTYSPHNVTYYDHMVLYLDYLYSENKLIGNHYPNALEYKIIHVCSDEDDLFSTCKDKMLKVIKDKTGYEFTPEELKKLDFDSIREYSYNY